MNKKISALSYAVTFAGCYLGAGYVSGQELWQFFGIFGFKGILGFVLTLLLLFFFGVILLSLARREGIEELDVVVAGDKITWLKNTVAVTESLGIYGDGLTHDTIRFVINYQYIRGINAMNFAPISFGNSRLSALMTRPNFRPEKPGFYNLEHLNRYFARLISQDSAMPRVRRRFICPAVISARAARCLTRLPPHSKKLAPRWRKKTFPLILSTMPA